MPRLLKMTFEADSLQRVGELAERLKAKPLALGTAPACALAALSIAWGVAPDEALRRALLGAAVCAGALPGHEVHQRK